jgi:hypothetical protein
MLLATLFVAVTGASASAHPIHTTLTQISWNASARVAEVTVRVFADDLEAAERGAQGDAAAFAFVRSSLVLADRAGRALPLAWRGQRRTGDVVWIEVEARAPDGITGVQVLARMLADRYADQVNIVQADYGGERRSLLFVRGDAPKRLP